MAEHQARKRFGQHFLHDRRVLENIVDAIDPRPGQLLVEIGPGLGALTRPLLARVPLLHAVEIDRDLADRLEAEFGPERLVLHRGDVLKFDFAALGEGLRLVGNLPYNISTPLLFRVAELGPRLLDAHFMLQREVVDRMAAAPGDEAYGRLSVTIQYRFRVERLIKVPPGAFTPPPKVDSAVVRLAPSSGSRARDEALFQRLVDAAFNQRRKMLRNCWAGLLSEADWARVGVAPTARGEELGVADYLRVGDLLAGAPAD